jgi:AcrR family transcriptional regulator
MDEKANTRDRILQAAMNRIKHYGYGKTTMAEIAADCDMSPGNIYRFFEAKIDIAEAMARNHYAEMQAELSAVARKKDWAADKRLREMFHKRMRDNYEMFDQSAKILEVADVLAHERPLFMNELLAQERVIITAVIEEGVKAGLFAVANPEFTAEMMQAATMKFSMPQMFSQLTLPRLEREFDGVMDILLNGLYAAGQTGGAKARDKQSVTEAT